MAELKRRVFARLAQLSAAFGGGRWPQLWLVPLLGAIAFVYAFYCTAGTFAEWPEYNRYYDLLAEGFRRGQLHLPVDPSADLLAKANPYDPRHRDLWMFDVSLYGGKYYLYWGPLPALLQALAKSLLGIHRAIGDQYLVYVFSLVSTVFGALLIESVARRHFPAVRRWLVGLAIVVFAFANPAPYLVATPGVYQAAITGGQAFALGGVFAAYQALVATSEVARRRLLLLAGVAFGCALSCRVSLGPGVALIGVAALAVQFRREKGWLRGAVIDALWLGLPVAAFCAGLLAYNRLRFDEWLEFGTRYQLTTLPFHVSTSFWGTNLYAYALTPYELSCRFPYLLQNWYQGPKGLPAWFELPPNYYVQEPVAGWMLAVPFTWFAPLAIVPMAWRRFREVPAPRALGFAIAAAVCLASVAGAAELGLYMATMRYLADVTNGLVLLGVLGAFTLCSVSERLLRRGAGLLVALLGLATLTCGLLLGVQGYIRHFARFNPALNSKLERSLSACPVNPPEPAKPARRAKRSSAKSR